MDMQELETARQHFTAALELAPDLPEAHQGLARLLTTLHDPVSAAPHWRKGFARRTLVRQPYRGFGPAIPMLLLVSAQDGNIRTTKLIDDTVFAVTALYADYADPAQDLPPHALVFNAIGDADLCTPALETSRTILSRTQAPIINNPDAVLCTGRATNAARLRSIPDVVTPIIRALPRAQILAARDLSFPLLVRAPGFHTGRHFLRIDRAEELAPSLATLPGEELLAIDFLDARGRDGLARKYRVMSLGGVLYPLHLAISADWKVHYVTAGNASNTQHRAEEQRFLQDMPGVLGPRAMTALRRIAAELNLDYAGIDFAVRKDGAVLLFEANATMAIIPPDADPVWDYRRAPISRALDAAKSLLLTTATGACR